MSQLGGGLCLSPPRLRGHKAREIKRLFPREQVVHGPTQLMGQPGERLGGAVFTFELGKGRLPRLALPYEEHGSFGQGPTQMDRANLLARSPEPFPLGFLGAFHPATGRHKILTRGKRAMSWISSRRTKAKICPIPGTAWSRTKVCTSCALALRVMESSTSPSN